MTRGAPTPDRDKRILEAAVSLAAKVGYRRITREAVANAAGVATGCINLAYGTMDRLRDAVLREAVARQHVEIVKQGLADGAEITRNLPPELKIRVAATL